MMNLYSSPLYIDELHDFLKTHDFRFLSGKTVLITGATGLIGSFLTDTLLIDPSFEVNIIALTTSVKGARERFSLFENDRRLKILETDLYKPINIPDHIDYILHLASKTSPHQYASEPIDTLMLSVLGTYNLLNLAAEKHARFLFFSSVEVYGVSDKESLNETDIGYLDPMEPRSNYNEGKRAAENLCVAFANEKNLEVSVIRLSRVFGPTARSDDRKAMSQFIGCAVNDTDIILKSSGSQVYSYTYAADAVSASLFVLEKGQNKEAYNISGTEELSLAEYASFIAGSYNLQVVKDYKTEEGVSYSKAIRAVLDITKIKTLGWTPKVNIKDGIVKTVNILKSLIR